MPVTFTASTYTYLWQADLPQAFAEIASAGYSGVELMAAPPHVELWRDAGPAARAIRDACDGAGTAVSSVVPAGLDVNLASPDGSMRAWSTQHYIDVGRLAAAIGARFLVIHPGRRHAFKPAPYAAAREWVIDGVSRIVEALEEEGVRPVFENTPSTILDSAEECLDVVRTVGRDRIGVCYDVANGFMVEGTAHGLRTTSEALELVHLSDTTAARWLHDPIGTGEVDFALVAATIGEIGFTGTIVAETIHRTALAEGLRGDRSALLRAGLADHHLSADV